MILSKNGHVRKFKLQQDGKLEGGYFASEYERAIPHLPHLTVSEKLGVSAEKWLSKLGVVRDLSYRDFEQDAMFEGVLKKILPDSVVEEQLTLWKTHGYIETTE